MSSTPIADYALLSDRHSAALVSLDGSVDWLCFPRFDSPSVFGRLLGDEAGQWSMRPSKVTQVTRRYLDRTMVLETRFRTPTGTVAVSDALAMGEGNRGHQLGKDAPHLLLRSATCVEGEVDLSLEYVLRPEYGQVHPRLVALEGGIKAKWGTDELVLSSPVPLTVDESAASAQFHLRSGETVGFALHHGKLGETASAKIWGQSEIAHTARRHRLGVGVMVGAPPGLRGPMEGSGPTQRASTPVTLLCTYRSDLCCGDHIASRGRGRQPQLGLPLRLGSGCLLHDPGSLGGSLP